MIITQPQKVKLNQLFFKVSVSFHSMFVVGIKTKIGLLTLLMFLLPTLLDRHSFPGLQAQVPIGLVNDPALTVQNTAIIAAKKIMEDVLKADKEFIGLIKDVGEFFKKANEVVNGSIKNMRMVKAIVEDYQQILDLYNKALSDMDDLTLSATNVDQVEEALFDKIRHTKILAQLLKETETGFELFTQLIEENSLNIDDKGRVILIQKTHQVLRRTKLSMKIAIRRINQEVLAARRRLNELQSYEAIFGFN